VTGVPRSVMEEILHQEAGGCLFIQPYIWSTVLKSDLPAIAEGGNDDLGNDYLNISKGDAQRSDVFFSLLWVVFD